MAVEGVVWVLGSGGLYEKSRLLGFPSNQIIGINANSRIVEVNTFNTTNGVLYGTFYITTTAGIYYISWDIDYQNNPSSRYLIYPATNNSNFRGIDLGDSRNLYVADYADNVVNVYAVNALVYSISVGRGPTEVKYNPILNHVYVCNYNDNTVSVINAATKAVVKTIPVGAGPDALQISCDGTKLYVANSLTNTITIISQLDKLKQDIFIPVAVSPTPSSSPTRTPAPSLSLTPTPTSTPIVANVFVASVSNGTRSASSLTSINPVVNFTINDNQTYLTDSIELELYSYNTATQTRTPKLYNGSTSTTFARTIYDPNNIGQPNGSSFSFDIPINSLPSLIYSSLQYPNGVTLVYSIRLRARQGNYIGPWSNYVEFAVYNTPIYYA
jgi:YVTN family beta-propeller protein